MITYAVTLNLPERSVRLLDQTADVLGLPRDIVVAQMLEDYARRHQQHLEIGRLTLEQLGLTPRPMLSIAEIQLEADDIAQAMMETYRSNDIVDIIRRERNWVAAE